MTHHFAIPDILARKTELGRLTRSIYRGGWIRFTRDGVSHLIDWDRLPDARGPIVRLPEEGDLIAYVVLRESHANGDDRRITILAPREWRIDLNDARASYGRHRVRELIDRESLARIYAQQTAHERRLA